MKSLVKAKSEPGLWLEDSPMPAVGHNDVLIRVKKTAICGTDMHIYNWDDWAQRTIPVPMIVGHEFMGEIVELGSEVSGFALGDRVSAEGHITCGSCRNCRAGNRHLCRKTQGIGVNRTGAFAEYISVPAFNVYKFPDEIPDDIAALYDPFGNAVHTALAQDMVGEDILITGAGPIGAMAAGIAKHVGAQNVVVTDVNDFRLDLAKTLGATRTVNVSREELRDVMAELNMTEGFDVGLEMSGAPSGFRQMLDVMNHGGRVALLGLLPEDTGINWDHVIFKGLEIRGIYGRRMFETWYKMSAMIKSGLDIDPIITHRMSAENFVEGFETINSGRSGKVILDWSAAS
ncbi:MAG: L-threonine 3-dehydrogenase [Parasphingopyxis sp.]